jgi:ABC-type transport system involved in multi-copper enzyme maturation permease subunit
MAGSSTFPRASTTGWRSGFTNLFGKESHAWWGSRRWLIQAVLWTFVVNGTLAFVMFGMPALLQQTDPTQAESFDAVVQGVQALFQIGSVALALGAILLAQDQILGERQSGVTEWILSKPVSRAAYILSKLAADAIGVVVVLAGLQSAIAYGLISLANGGPLPLVPFLIGAGGLALHTLFYLALTLMMGVLAGSRGLLLGVPLGVLFGGMLAVNLLGKVAFLTPWSLAAVLPAAALQTPLPLPIGLPLATTAFLTPLAILIAVWNFKRLEF